MTEQSKNNNELKYLELAYRAVDYECGRSNISLSDEDKKLYRETLEYLDTLIDNVKQPSMWLARDKDGTLWLYIDEPRRSSIFSKWEVDTEKSLLRADDCMEINGDLFPELEWEDKPIQIKLIKSKRV